MPPRCCLGARAGRAAAQAGVTVEADPAEALLETGFRELYELNFKGAREHFLSYQKMQPGDPMGKAAEAASYLYEEFNAKGVFTSEFFLNDYKLLGGVEGKASAEPQRRIRRQPTTKLAKWPRSG